MMKQVKHGTSFGVSCFADLLSGHLTVVPTCSFDLSFGTWKICELLCNVGPSLHESVLFFDV